MVPVITEVQIQVITEVFIAHLHETIGYGMSIDDEREYIIKLDVWPHYPLIKPLHNLFSRIKGLALTAR